MQSIDLIGDNLKQSERRVLARVEEMREHCLVRPTPQGGCHTLWVLGHLAYIEQLVIRTFMLGEANPLADWENVFDGDDVSGDIDQYPPFDQVLATCRDVRVATVALLGSLSEPDLDTSSARVPLASKTRLVPTACASSTSPTTGTCTGDTWPTRGGRLDWNGCGCSAARGGGRGRPWRLGGPGIRGGGEGDPDGGRPPPRRDHRCRRAESALPPRHVDDERRRCRSLAAQGQAVGRGVHVTSVRPACRPSRLAVSRGGDHHPRAAARASAGDREGSARVVFRAVPRRRHAVSRSAVRSRGGARLDGGVQPSWRRNHARGRGAGLWRASGGAVRRRFQGDAGPAVVGGTSQRLCGGDR